MGVLGDTIVDALTELLRLLFSPITQLIEEQGNEILHLVVNTPHPNAVFEAPTNGPWPGLYNYYWDTWIPMLLFLWAGMVGLVIFFESTSHLFGSYHRSKLKRRAFSGLLGILSWWWMAGLSLRFLDALTGVILPSLSDISLFQTLSFTGMGTLGLVVSLSVDMVLFVLIGLIYSMRQVVLYLFVLLMPLLIVFWIPGVGPFSLVSRFMRRLAGFYVPFLFMTVPVAMLLRLGGILGASFGLSLDSFGTWIVALIIPIVAVLSPFVLVWQAGALFFMADRALNHASSRQARTRLNRMQSRAQATTQAGRNFMRGFHGERAVRRDGQMMLDTSESRSHAAGSRLRSTRSNLQGLLNGSDEGNGGEGSEDGVGDSADSESRSDRATDFEQLRNQQQSRSHGSESSQTSEEGTRSDDTPRYIY
jgi:hypothetical protein